MVEKLQQSGRKSEHQTRKNSFEFIMFGSCISNSFNTFTVSQIYSEKGLLLIRNETQKVETPGPKNLL